MPSDPKLNTTATKPPCAYCGMWHGPRCPAREEAEREIERLRTVLARIAGPWEPDDELTALSARMRQAATEGLGVTPDSKTAGSLARNEYRCCACGGIFAKGWSDDEAQAELAATFPGANTENCDLVCDDCFKLMGLG